VKSLSDAQRGAVKLLLMLQGNLNGTRKGMMKVQTNIFQGAEMIASPMSGFANIYHHIIVPYSVRLKELHSLH